MSETLLIHYSPDQELSFLLFDEKNTIIQTAQQGDIETLTSLAKTRKVRMLYDAAYLNIESVNIPGNNRQRQLQAVPFALEDRLASDIDDLHFALGKKQDDDQIPVVVIEQLRLKQCLALFEQAEITLEHISADVLALPYEDHCWTVLIMDKGVLIKTSEKQGHYCDRENLQALLQSSLEIHKDEISKIHFIYKTTDNEIVELFDDLDIEISSREYNQYPLEILATQISDTSQINILQAAYATQRKSNPLWKTWKSVAAIVGVLIILQLVSASIETQQLQKKNNELAEKVKKEFKRVNPGARKFNNMRKRMERRLKALQTGGGSNNSEVFLQLLSDTAPTLGKQAKIKITALVYRNKRIDMELTADSLQTLEAVKNQLTSLSRIKTVLSTSVEKNKVSGRLRLEKQG